MTPIHQKAEYADVGEGVGEGSDEESYIEEEIIETDDDYEMSEEEFIEEEIIEDDEIIEEEVDDDDDDEPDDSPKLKETPLKEDSKPIEMDKKSNPKSAARSKLLLEIAAQRKLAENLKRQNSSDSKRKQALAQLRRQAARDELARNNSKLKVGKVARSTASASTASSLTGDIRKKSATERISVTVDLEKINAVEIPRRQTPVSPLRSRDDSSRRGSSQIANSKLKSKLKPTPLQKTTSSSHSRVTEWIREDPMENEPASNDALQSKEDIRFGVASEKPKTKDAESSISEISSRLKKQQSLGTQRSFGQSVGGESGPVPLKSRSNDMSTSSTSEMNLNVKVDNYYSLAQLQAKSVDGIDGAYREKYLSPKDFEAHFKMTKEEFYKLPRWKQSE
ncbi:MAG: hypothetical protein SGBAC_009139, partial [Bacillariaceae sp.]